MTKLTTGKMYELKELLSGWNFQNPTPDVYASVYDMPEPGQGKRIGTYRFAAGPFMVVDVWSSSLDLYKIITPESVLGWVYLSSWTSIPFYFIEVKS